MDPWHSPLSDGDSIRFKLEGFDCVARAFYDSHADTSYLGSFDDEQQSPNAIDHHEKGEWLWRSEQGPRWFNPADEGFSPAEVAQDYARLVEYHKGYWAMLGIVVTVSLEGVELGDDSLWGIASDSDADYFCEVAQDCASEAIKIARASLANLCASASKLPREGSDG